jgi:hypothetical protein
MHRGDVVLYQAERYDLLLWAGELEQVSPRAFGVEPRPKATFCQRGFYHTYTVTDRLNLSYFHVGLSEDDERKALLGTGPIIHDTSPREYFIETHVYERSTKQWKMRISKAPCWLYEVNQPLSTNGFIRIGKGRVQKRGVVSSPSEEDWIHDTIYDIRLKEGRVIAVIDRSDEEKRANDIPVRKWLKTLRSWLADF